jgi:hypothetical protein
LAIDWNTESHTLSVDFRDILDKTTEPVTKRQLLKTTARFYYPLGLFSTEDTLPGNMMYGVCSRRRFCPMVLKLGMNGLLYYLCYPASKFLVGWVLQTVRRVRSVFFVTLPKELTGLSSIRSTSGESVMVRLVRSKNRLAPVKKVSLRLELLAAIVGARLPQYFCRETGMDIGYATLWTDATVVLSWIRSNLSRWKTFICNRVTEIQTYTPPAQWNLCPGEDNLSRGVNAGQLIQMDTWWRGPAWLSKGFEFWPRDVVTADHPPTEERKSTLTVLHIQTPGRLLDPSWYSYYWKLLLCHSLDLPLHSGQPACSTIVR